MAIMYENAPYIHSNIYSFHSELNRELGSISPAKQDDKIEKMITALTEIKKSLETEAVNFITSFDDEKSGGVSASSVSNARQAGQWLTNYLTIQNGSDTFLETCRKIGMEVLREKDILSTIKPTMINLNSLSGIVRKSVLDEIQEGISNNTIEISELANILAGEVAKDLQVGSSKDRYKVDASKVFTKASASHINSLFTRQITKNSELIKKRIKEDLKRYINSNGSKRSQSQQQEIRQAGQNFINRLRQRLPQDEYQKNIQQFDKFATTFLDELVRVYDNKKISDDKSGLTGDLGEQFAAAITNASDGSLSIEVIATQSEEKIGKDGIPAKALKKTLDVQKMKTHHQDNKMSQTDLVFISPGGRAVRVQSKNSLEVYQLIINGQNVPQTAKLQEEKNLGEFMDQLMHVPGGSIFSQSEYDAISYLYANMMWFNIEGTYNEGAVRKRDAKNINKSGLLGPMMEIEKNLSMGAASLLGITLDSIITKDLNVVSGSNIFYQFSNKVIVPTSIIFENLIDFLNGVQETQFQLRVTGIKSSADFGEYDKDSLYKAKQEAVESEGGFKPELRYQSAALVSTGAQPGKSFMEKFKISRINLRVDPSVLLNSSYLMNPK